MLSNISLRFLLSPSPPPVPQTYCKLTLPTFIFSSPVYVDNAPFSILVGADISQSCLQDDRAMTLQIADSAGPLLDAEKPPSPGTLGLLN